MSAVISWIRRRRSTSSCEYNRVPFGERLGSIKPLVSYIRSVCGCISASSAATEIMNTPRLVLTVVRTTRLRRAAISSVTRRAAGLLEQTRPRVAVHGLRKAIDRLALLRRERLRNVDHEPVVDVAVGLAAQAGRPIAAQRLDGPVLGAPGHTQAL